MAEAVLVFHEKYGEGRAISRNKAGDVCHVQFVDGIRSVAIDFLRPVIEPVDLWGHFEPPELPRGLLPQVLEGFSRIQADQMGADPAGLAMAALAVCSAAIPDRIALQVKRHDPNWRESARIWVALIGDPSTKKSPIMGAALRPINAIDTRLFQEWSEARSAFDALPKEEQKLQKPPRQTRLRLGDTTIEAAQEVLADSPDGVLLVQDELSGWFGSMEKYAGAKAAAKDRGFWLESFNGGSYQVGRVGRGQFLIPNLSVSLLGGIQPEPIRKVAAEAADDGLLQRLFPVILKPATMGRDEPMPDVVMQYAQLVEGLHGLTGPRVAAGDISPLLRFSDEAQEVRRRMEERHLSLMAVEGVNRKLAAHIGKLDGLFARLCIVWHAIEHVGEPALPKEIDASTATRVSGFLSDFLLRHAFAFYAGTLGLSDDHERIKAVDGYILAHRMQVMTNRDVQRGDRTMRGIERNAISRIFEQLEALGWVESEPGRRATDPPRWTVNPAVHRRFATRAERERMRRDEARDMIAEIAMSASNDK